MRSKIIERLEKRLGQLNKQLIEKYDAKVLVLYLRTEKEIEIQKAYTQLEDN